MRLLQPGNPRLSRAQRLWHAVFNLPVIRRDDIVIQRMSWVNSRAGDVFVFISHSGRTKNMVELARLARVNGSTRVAVIFPDSLLAHEAVALVPDVPGDTDVCLPGYCAWRS